MAEEIEGVTETQDAQAAEPAQTQQEPEPKAQEPDLEHWKSMSRKNERDAKAARAELAALQESQAKAAADLEAAGARIAELEAERAYAEAVRQVAESTGYPERVVRGLRGDTVEELAASAEVLRGTLSAYPPSRDAGEPRPAGVTREDIEGIKDPVRRVRARAEHIELWRQ